MSKEKQIKELKETIEKAQKQVEQLENESNEDRYIKKKTYSDSNNDFYVIMRDEDTYVDCEYTKMPMIKVDNYKDQNDGYNCFQYLEGFEKDFLDTLDELDLENGEHNIYLHIEKAE